MADWEGAGILPEGQQLLFLKPFDFTDFFNQGLRNVLIIKKGQLTLEASLVHLYFAKDGKMWQKIINKEYSMNLHWLKSSEMFQLYVLHHN